jgi:hypothetical protein
MLENKIDELTNAVIALTEAIKNQAPTLSPSADSEDAPKPKSKPKTKPKTKQVEESSAEAETILITSQLVQDMARKIIAAGTPRSDIKDIITEIGADSIADLSDSGLVSFHKKLTAIQEA